MREGQRRVTLECSLRSLRSSGTLLTRKPVQIVGILLAPVAPLAVGVVIMRGGSVPAGIWLLNVAATVVGLSLAACALVWPGPVTRIRGSLRWAVLAGVFLLGASLPAHGTEGVHRWLAIGPVQIHAGSLLLPPMLVALLETPWITSVVAAFAVQVVLLLQPDAAQAASFCAAWVGIASVRGETRAREVIILSILLAAACMLRPDPLEPVPHVEGIVGMAAAQALILATAALVSLPVVPLALAWFLERRVGIVLAIYFVGLLIAAWLGNHPVPIAGYGVSPILGYYSAVTMAALLGRARRETPGLAATAV